MLTRTRVSSTPRHRDPAPKGRWKKALSLVASGALVIGMGVSGALFAAAPANAAVPLGTVEAQVSGQKGGVGLDGSGGSTSGYCLRYSPPNSHSETGPTNWVTSSSNPNEARAAHGMRNNCYDNNNWNNFDLEVNNQSTIGVRPVAGSLNPEPGTAFNIGRIIHYNNPINYPGSGKYFAGTVSYKLPTINKQFDYKWWLNETTNTWDPDESRDQVKFLNQASDTTITSGGMTYKLVMLGFYTVDNNADCPATPPADASIVNDWRTYESQQTHACLYGQLSQVRNLTIVKNVTGAGAPAQSFTFAPTSTLAGSAWTSNFNLTAGQNKAGAAVQGETITVAENALPNAQWSLESLKCVDGTGAALGGFAGYDLANRKLTLTNIPAAATAAAANITCTFTNHYTTQAQLTLKKVVKSDGDATPALPTAWTLKATGPGSNLLSGTTPATSTTLEAGTYSLSESGGDPAYTQDGNWVCTNDSGGGSVTVTNGKVDLKDKDKVTCTVTNRYMIGSLSVKKVITDPTGFSGNASTPFTGSWSCTPSGMSGNYSVTTGDGAKLLSDKIPAGDSCTVTENGPTGNLKNDSYEWVQYTTDGPKQVTDKGSATITVTNSTKQNTGSFTVDKKVVAADANTPNSGYTGGTARQFKVDYTCTIGGATAASGTLTVTPGTPATKTGIPASASCALTEQAVTAQAGDFADGSYEWVGGAIVPNTVVIAKNETKSATVTNTFKRNLTNLEVTKKIEGAGYTGSGEDFTVNVLCGAEQTQLKLSNNGTKSVSNIPVGTLCTVQEVLPVNAPIDAAHEWGSPSYAPGTQVTAEKGKTAKVTVTNTTVPVFGLVSVTKQIDGGGVAADKTFDIVITCGSQTFNATLKGGESYTTNAPIAAGTECTVHENAVSGGLVNDSYSWAAAPVTNDQKVTVVKNTTKNVVVTNTTQREYGSLTITKNLVQPDGFSYAGADFTGTYSCTDGTEGDWSLAGGESTSVDGILLGSDCTVVETVPGAPSPTDASYVWSGIGYAPNAKVTLSAAERNPGVTVTNTIVRQSGSFAIAKTVNGDQAGYDASKPFDFGWICTDDSGKQYSGTLSALAGGSPVSPVEAIPAGSDCTVTEQAEPAPNSGYTWDGVTLTTSTGGTQDGRSIGFTIPASTDENPGVVQVNAVNTITPKYGYVEITKLVDSAGYTGGADFEFTASVVCGPNSYQVPFTTNGSDKLKLPLGASCTVTEVAPTGGLADGSWAWDTSSVDPESFTIESADQQVDVEITNTLKRVYGAVVLQKTLSDPADVVDPNREFSGTWQCVYGDGSGDNTVGGDWTAKAGQTPVLLNDHVLVGSDCEVTGEDLSVKPGTDPSYVWAQPALTDGTVAADAPALLKVANTVNRETGSITVEKTVTGDTEGYVPSAGGTDFPIAYDCSVDGVAGHIKGEVQVAKGASTVLVDGVPFGWSCKISEGQIDPDTLKDASYSWGTPKVSPDTVTLSSTNQKVNVAVENPITQSFGSFTVTKKLKDVPGKVVKDGTEYSGTWSCEYDGDEDFASGTWKITDKNGGTTAAFGPVPLTATCQVTEDSLDNGDLLTGWSWGTPVIGDAVTIDSTEVKPNIDVTNSVKQQFGALEVTKQTSGETAGIVDGENVAGAWQCTWTDGEGDAQQQGGRWTAPATGGDASYTGTQPNHIPVGADCTVTEDTPIAAELKDASYAWGAPDNGEKVTIVNGEPATITVKNTVTRVTGTVIIDKVVTGPAEKKGLIDPALQVGGTLVCTYDGVETSYPWTATVAGNATVPGILATSSCEATETAKPALPVPTDPSYQWLGQPSYDGNPAVVPSAGTEWPVVKVTNDTFRAKGDFTVTKLISGTEAAQAGVDPEGEYTFQYTCTTPDKETVKGTLTGKANEALYLPKGTDLPAGTDCTVTEPVASLPPLKDDSYSWGTVSYELVGAEGTPGDRSISFEVQGGDAETAKTVIVKATNPVIKTDGSFTTSKTSDPASGSTVKPGDTITYTVTVTPGADSVTVHDIVAVDDLAGVLGKATLDEDGITASTGSFIFDEATKKLTWTVGDLAPADGPQTLVYSVKVNADAWNATIGNSVTAGGDVPSDECTVEEPCTTDHHTDPEPAHLTLVKVVDNSAFEGKLEPGQVPGNVSDWVLTAAGQKNTVTGNGGSATIVDQEVAPGAYSIGETLDETSTNPLLAYYQPGDWSCEGGVDPSEGVLTLEPGANVTCTIVNTAETVDLKIVKEHVSDVDGTQVVPTDEDASYPYEITVTNKTPKLTVPNVVVTDELPATLKAAPIDEWDVPSGWTPAIDGVDENGFGGTVTFTKAAWTPGEGTEVRNEEGELVGWSYTFGFTVTTAAELPREGDSATGKILDIVNTATVKSGGVEGDPDDNTSTEETPVKSLEVSAQAMCLANAPWVEYELTPYNTDGVATPIVMIWWTAEAYANRDPSIPASDIDAILADGASKVDQIAPPADAEDGVTITGKQLWPGAAVDAAGNGIAWTGWKQLPTGQWVLDPSAPFYDLRGSAVVEFRMNPTTDSVEAYPPATPGCNAAPTQPKPSAMATTGFDPSWGLWGAGILVIGGAVLLLIIRRRRTAE